ncbi:MAG: L-2-amino-thiazoline-4-carboxylic acid hydrolase [Candidatus Aminicenantes bacterium]|nr:L-2-amino-thiazoline-4-carboxylic acid hydrolase [Candidatus Aminicenantes bacterium]
MKIQKTSRRQFITSVIPACAVTCMASNRVFASILRAEGQSSQEPKHKFDNDFKRPITFRQVFQMQYQHFLFLAMALEKEMGKEKAIAFLKKASTERLTDLGKQQASRMPDNNFGTYVNQFRSGFDNTLTMEIVEDTKTAFELKVTECIMADTFLRAKAGDIGYAWVCWGDYAWAEGFNPKIKLVRDKTLMQGHDCCNHRYIWQG